MLASPFLLFVMFLDVMNECDVLGKAQHPRFGPTTEVPHCDFYLFLKVKSELKGARFEGVESVKAKVAETLNKMTDEDFQHCFSQWKIRVEWCRGSPKEIY